MARHSQLFKKLVRPYFILLTVIISVATVIAYYASVSRVRNETVKSLRKLAERTAKLTDTFIDELDSLAVQVNHQPKITGFFYNIQSGDNDNSNYFDTDVLNSIDISSTLKDLLAGRTGDYNILIYNDKGDYVSSHNHAVNRDKIAEYLMSGSYTETLKAIRTKGEAMVYPPSVNPWTNSGSVYITLKTELKNEYSRESCGIIEVRASLSLLDELLSDGGNGGQVLIRNLKNGEIIYPYEHKDEENLSYITAPLGSVGWEAEIPYRDGVSGGFRLQLILLFAVLYIILISLMLAASVIIGKHVSEPILKLAGRVREIDTPEGKLKPTEGAIDEIKELEESFNTMLKHMNNSLQREKKAYSLALQAQMNPHFLYNSLSVIGAAGLEAGADRVYDMCIELSDMLRYVAAYEKVTVQLKEEITHTKNYLSLMKSRYEDYFEYSIYVDETLFNMPVPKLFIQPLAENCFMHGFKEKEPPWKIEITMCGTRKNWELVIRDNGSGISRERINEIYKKEQKSSLDMTVSDIGGLGIVNTVIRLKITHNSDITYEIKNDNGTVIRITSGKSKK